MSSSFDERQVILGCIKRSIVCRHAAHEVKFLLCSALVNPLHYSAPFWAPYFRRDKYQVNMMHKTGIRILRVWSMWLPKEKWKVDIIYPNLWKCIYLYIYLYLFLYFFFSSKPFFLGLTGEYSISRVYRADVDDTCMTYSVSFHILTESQSKERSGDSSPTSEMDSFHHWTPHL